MSKTELIEKLREKSIAELSEIYNISRSRTENLNNAIRTVYFPKLTNKEWSIKQMAEETGLSEATVESYRSALIKVGLEEKRKRRRGYKSPAQDKIFSFITDNPSTYEEIVEGTKKSLPTVYNLVFLLKKKKKVRTVTMSSKRRSSSSVSSFRLFSDLTKKVIVYLPGEEKQLGEKIIKHVPKKFTPGEKSSLTRRSRKILPEEAFEVVHDYTLKCELKRK